ncbi:MAG: hypothetical protein LBD61_05645 [Endomicrobium sp.]|jgi:hypothetical protein|nr:hypothetical protein [Endomicrobium sp.]
MERFNNCDYQALSHAFSRDCQKGEARTSCRRMSYYNGIVKSYSTEIAACRKTINGGNVLLYGGFGTKAMCEEFINAVRNLEKIDKCLKPVRNKNFTGYIAIAQEIANGNLKTITCFSRIDAGALGII